MRLYHEVDETVREKIKHEDVSSLYQWVNKTKMYPVGYPTIITNPDDQNIYHYFGMVKLDIIPPPLLYHPVLPYQHGEKLTFPVCAMCVKDQMLKDMTDRSYIRPPAPEERCLRGMWCTPEIIKAVEQGYIIVKIHEVWHKALSNIV